MTQLPLRGDPASDPFTGRRLLERALVVVRFTPVLKIGETSGVGIADFQEAVRGEYPLAELEKEAVMRLELRPDGKIDAAQEEQPVWRLSSIDKAWRVSLTPQSLALEVGSENYQSWTDFSSRINELVEQTARCFRPSHRQYIGVRYINSAPIDGGQDPRNECAQELVSITGNGDLQMADLLWRFAVDEGHMILRSGVMPPSSSYDPNVFAPREGANWYLDIDVGNGETLAFEAEQIKSSILAQVKRLHAVYRWAMQQSAV